MQNNSKKKKIYVYSDGNTLRYAEAEALPKKKEQKVVQPEKPKKKKVKHLNPKQECISSLGGKLESGVKIFDAEIRKALAPLRDQGLDAPCKEVE